MNKDDNAPFVSCIITTHNRSKLLQRAIDSVLKQEYTNIELIIVDDNSSDDTADVVAQFKDDRITYLRNKENLGLSAARNIGVKSSSGKFIAFLDDDDEWYPHKTSKQMEAFRNTKFKNTGLVYTWMQFKTGTELLHELSPVASGPLFKYAIDDQPISAGSTWMIAKKVFEGEVAFDEEIPRGVDGDFVRQVSLKFDIDFVPEVLVNYYVEHQHSRMTNNSNDGVKKAILGQEITLRKFEKEISQFPRQESSLLAITAYDYAKIGNHKKAVSYFSKAIRTSVFSLNIYKNLVKMVMLIIGLKNES